MRKSLLSKLSLSFCQFCSPAFLHSTPNATFSITRDIWLKCPGSGLKQNFKCPKKVEQSLDKTLKRLRGPYKNYFVRSCSLTLNVSSSRFLKQILEHGGRKYCETNYSIRFAKINFSFGTLLCSSHCSPCKIVR